jgi:hypothetical protein
MLVVALLVSVVGFVVVAVRMWAQLRRKLSFRAAKRTMAECLRASLRRQNLRQSFAMLRVTREIEIPPVEDAMTRQHGLMQRVEQVRRRNAVVSSGRPRRSDVQAPRRWDFASSHAARPRVAPMLANVG